MALFLEVHEAGGRGVGEVEQAHAADLPYLRDRGIRYLKHWENARTGHVMCLVEAPDADALRRARGELQAVVVKEVTDLLPPPSGTRTVR